MHYQIDTLVEHNRYLAFFIAFYYITFNCSLNYLYFWHTHTPIHTHTHTQLFFVGGCTGSSLLHTGVLWSQRIGATPRCGVCTSHCSGFSSLQSTGSVVVVQGPGCTAACEICPNQGSNSCPLHWQANPYLLCHQGSAFPHFLTL